MKKLLVILASVVLLTACECPYKEECETRCTKTKVVYFGTLSFYEEKLFGYWGVSDPMRFGNEYVKMITITDYGLANIQLQDPKYTDRYNRTYQYVYSGTYITFYELGSYGRGYEFKLTDYKPGSLWLRDSFGKYELRCYGGW